MLTLKVGVHFLCSVILWLRVLYEINENFIPASYWEAEYQIQGRFFIQCFTTNTQEKVFDEVKQSIQKYFLPAVIMNPVLQFGNIRSGSKFGLMFSLK
jgi:hypothetical protein